MKSREISRSKLGPFPLACTDLYISIGWESNLPNLPPFFDSEKFQTNKHSHFKQISWVSKHNNWTNKRYQNFGTFPCLGLKHVYV